MSNDKNKGNGNTQDPNPQHGNDNHENNGKQHEGNGQIKKQIPSHALAWTRF